MTQPDPWLSMQDIADREQVSLRTVKRWKAEGKLPEPTVRLTPGGGRRVRWRESQLSEQYEFPIDDL